jgi:hypothetical protein
VSTIREKRALREKTNEKADMKAAQIELVKLQLHH